MEDLQVKKWKTKQNKKNSEVALFQQKLLNPESNA
jgi:hypothetical protein